MTCARLTNPNMKTPLRALVLEDQPLDVELLCARLKAEGFEPQPTCVCDSRGFEDALTSKEFDVIFSDYSLPQFDGLTAVRLAREKSPDVPCILVSGTLGEEQAVECLKAGATDYVLKQRLARLGSAVRRALEDAEVRRREKQAAATIRELSRRLLRLQDGERRRIAHALHEEVAQHLTALGMNLSVAEELLNSKQTKLKKILSECRTISDEALKEIRTLSYLLHPPILEALGLPGALRDYVHGLSRRSGIAIELSVPEDFARLPAEVETALFRVAQESLTNVQRHSGSNKAMVELRRDDKEIVLEIQDFGRGIPPERLNGANASSELGVGIVGMREWLSQLGGRLAIDGSQAGTRVTAVVAHEPVSPERTHA